MADNDLTSIEISERGTNQLQNYVNKLVFKVCRDETDEI